MKIRPIALTAGCGVVATIAAIYFVAPSEPIGNHHFDTTQGMVAVVDKESGTLRAPTSEEALRYQVPVQAKKEPLQVQRRADGSETMKLDESYTTYSLVVRNADGSWRRQCSMNHDHALHAQRAVK